MKKSNGKAVPSGILVVAVCATILVLLSCGGDGTAPSIRYSLIEPITLDEPGRVFEYSLGGRLLKVSMLTAEDQITEVLVTYAVTDFLHVSKFLSANEGKFSLAGLNLQYVPALSPCQPGGLYLISGRVRAPGGDLIEYRNIKLASWDTRGDPVDPWMTPLDLPVLVSQSAGTDWQSGDPLVTLGSWTYLVDYRSSLIIPAGCSLQTLVELTLSSADASVPSRVYHYTVTETNSGGLIERSIAAAENDAPVLAITVDEPVLPDSPRHLSFAGLDALRDARAQIRIAYAPFAPADPLWIAFSDALQPFIAVSEGIYITEDKPSATLAAHLSGFFTALTAPLAATPHPASVVPTATVKIGTYLATPGPGGFPIIIPLNLVAGYGFKTGVDDQSDCAGKPVQGLCCTLASAMKNAAYAQGAPASGAFYILDVTFYGTTLQPLLRMQKVMIPIEKITD
jgi:hypothetical protein